VVSALAEIRPIAAPRLSVIDFASAFTCDSSSDATVRSSLAVIDAAVPAEVWPVAGPIHELTSLSSTACSVVSAFALRMLMLRFRLVAETVFVACAFTSRRPTVTCAPSSTNACVFVASFDSRSIPPIAAKRPPATEVPSRCAFDTEIACTLMGPPPMFSVPAPRYACVVRLTVAVASTPEIEIPVEIDALSANDVTVLLSFALTSSVFAVIVPPAEKALVVPLIRAFASTPANEPPAPGAIDSAPASVLGSELPVNDAWMLTALPDAVRLPFVFDAVTFGLIVSFVFAAAPPAAMKPTAADSATAVVFRLWFAEARMLMSPSMLPLAVSVESELAAVIAPPALLSAKERPTARP
jgi:hypothetical protein